MGTDDKPKIVKCDDETLTQEYNMKQNAQKRCFPVVALVIVSNGLCYAGLHKHARAHTHHHHRHCPPLYFVNVQGIALLCCKFIISMSHLGYVQVLLTLGMTAFSASQVLLSVVRQTRLLTDATIPTLVASATVDCAYVP